MHYRSGRIVSTTSVAGTINGELLFYPSIFESLQDGKKLNIIVGKAVITRIENVSLRTYTIDYIADDKLMSRDAGNIASGLQSFA